MNDYIVCMNLQVRISADSEEKAENKAIEELKDNKIVSYDIVGTYEEGKEEYL